MFFQVSFLLNEIKWVLGVFITTVLGSINTQAKLCSRNTLILASIVASCLRQNTNDIVVDRIVIVWDSILSLTSLEPNINGGWYLW